MNIFLVQGRVDRTEYMGDSRSFDDIRLVKAENEAEAQSKYEEFWRSKTSEYSVYYHAYGDVQQTVE